MDGYLSTTEAAKYLNVARVTLYRLVSKGEISVNKPGGKLFFTKADLDDYIMKGRKTAINS